MALLLVLLCCGQAKLLSNALQSVQHGEELGQKHADKIK